MGDRYTAQEFIDKIPGSAGIVTTIALRVGCAWHTAKKYIEQHPTVKAAYDAECERVLDAAELSSSARSWIRKMYPRLSGT